ncbi:MAG TPA: nitrophenyl compound nitroreductase subunit ArsF family protein [Sedimentisphaerales bacterium]|jgi:hypothetical protein|nr:nitrophenyl compound nitroreductase subunit ArsF family protein [Sedimentisphaerales bacterium]
MGDPPTAAVLTEPASRTSIVYVYYFHRTFRCISCQMMEDLAAQTMEQHFVQQTQKGRVVWMTVNIDEPEGKALGQPFNARGSELVVARMEDGVCKDSKRLDEIWGLKDQPEVFSQVLVDEIKARLTPVQSR